MPSISIRTGEDAQRFDHGNKHEWGFS